MLKNDWKDSSYIFVAFRSLSMRECDTDLELSMSSEDSITSLKLIFHPCGALGEFLGSTTFFGMKGIASFLPL